MINTISYDPRFHLVDGCLTETRITKQGSSERKLCNFAPYLTEEVTVDDGVETSTRIKLRGVHQSGRELPEIEISGAELSSFNWLPEHWGMDCILEIGQNMKDSVRYAIQTTAAQAVKKTVYTVTGWKKIAGTWEFLLPGDAAHTVKLPGKLHGYKMAGEAGQKDLSFLLGLLTDGPAEETVLLPLLALTFLSPLNHFLALAGCEPKFVLFLIGKTGSRKSTLAALMLSFFGRFTATELPLSFQDTANSILYNAFSLKDVLTCIDDFHPATRAEEQKLTAAAQTVLRAYGDRVGRGRLRSDATPMESRPPQGNAIVTAEFPPDIGESGTARYFALEMNAQSVDLERLSYYQARAAEGVLARCMRSYLGWLRTYYLNSDNTVEDFLLLLRSNFEGYRDEFRKSALEDNADSNLFNQFFDAIVEHYKENREVNYYAQLLCLSPKYFGNIIKQETGMSAGYWISHYVTTQAKMMLRSRRDLSIQQIGDDLGFDNQAIFSRYFKHVVGVTPSEYRQDSSIEA